MATVLFVQTPVHERDGHFYLAEGCAKDYGKTWSCNTGDLLVCDSLLKELTFDSWENLMIPLSKEPLPLPPSINFERINADFDYVILRGSNYINDHLDLAPFADFVERLKIPFIPIGLGVQSPSYAEVSLSEGTKRFIRMLNSCCERVGVRGNFSAEVLDTHGVKNQNVIGCPTMYRTLKPSISVKKNARYDESFKVGLTTNRHLSGAYAADASRTRTVQSRVIEEVAKLKHGKLVSQGERDEFYVARKVSEFYDGSLERILEYFGAAENAEISDLVVNRNTVYFDVGKWAAYVGALDFIVGLRLHGNIIALQEGVPAVFITYDSRIREISEFMHLPYLDVSNPLVMKWSLAELYDNADFTRFEQTYVDRYYGYVQFLESNSVEHRLVSRARPSIGPQMGFSSNY